ncbi:putative mitochondrial ribosomal protein L24 [Hibiscus syriacus]|uniref:Mitochondrial ribosomal protein L24 n=1 Tax=Hibiscus syriacus TaxID=106335 RepID=A0A6A2Y7I8_HIBSY|nr:putative mitochondrial ribosomal protein L24 [Hibiscus syriacus]
MSGSMDCACLIFTASVPIQLPINRTLAISLPQACNMDSVPVQCKAYGTPLPAPDRHFSTAIKAEKGRVDILTKFTENSDLLRTIENYRLALLVANPGVFVVPNHFDADAIFVVTQGRGRITLIHEDKRQSFDIETGDIIRVRAGTPLYLVNSDDIEKLFIVKLLQHVNRPDHYDVFYGAEGAKPESFSTEILEATLKTSREKLESFFEKQGKDAFLEASKEQIEAMSSREEGTGGGGIWPFGTQSKNPFNLFRKHRPSKSNKYGQLFEVDADEFKLLKDFDLRVSYANISRGSMTAPFYNSRAIKISIVVQGQGYIEMVASKASRKSGYEKRSSSLRPDTVFVIPAGHPFVTVASRRTNLEILCFEVNIENNVRYLPAGEGNFAQRFEKEAKELAFKSREDVVDWIFGQELYGSWLSLATKYLCKFCMTVRAVPLSEGDVKCHVAERRKHHLAAYRIPPTSYSMLKQRVGLGGSEAEACFCVCALLLQG